MNIENIARDAAKKIVNGLDAARSNSSHKNPVHEVEMIEAGVLDAIFKALAEVQEEDRRTG